MLETNPNKRFLINQKRTEVKPVFMHLIQYLGSAFDEISIKTYREK